MCSSSLQQVALVGTTPASDNFAVADCTLQLLPAPSPAGPARTRHELPRQRAQQAQHAATAQEVLPSLACPVCGAFCDVKKAADGWLAAHNGRARRSLLCMPWIGCMAPGPSAMPSRSAASRPRAVHL